MANLIQDIEAQIAGAKATSHQAEHRDYSRDR
jgi:hypothetical protein